MPAARRLNRWRTARGTPCCTTGALGLSCNGWVRTTIQCMRFYSQPGHKSTGVSPGRAGCPEHGWMRGQRVTGRAKKHLPAARGDWRGKTAGPRNSFPFTWHLPLTTHSPVPFPFPRGGPDDLFVWAAPAAKRQWDVPRIGRPYPALPQGQKRGHIFILPVALLRAFGRRAHEKRIAELFNSAILLRKRKRATGLASRRDVCRGRSRASSCRFATRTTELSGPPGHGAQPFDVALRQAQGREPSRTAQGGEPVEPQAAPLRTIPRGGPDDLLVWAASAARGRAAGLLPHAFLWRSSANSTTALLRSRSLGCARAEDMISTSARHPP